MSPSLRRVRLAFSLAVCSAAIAACGGGGDDETAGTAAAQTVAGTNSAPAISGTPTTAATQGQLYTFTPNATDADGDTLTFSGSNVPSWATLSAATGTLTGTPTTTGTFANIVISVSDGRSSTALAAFSITVQASTSTNMPPTISGTPRTTATAGVAYSFRPTASDANSDPLTFSIANRPAWASFSASSGRLSGTPSSANVGTYSNIVISVNDGTATQSLPAFSIAVAASTSTNTPPTISGNPLTTVLQGRAYAFVPAANDADGNNLSFSIANAPSWATFNTATGALTGLPTLGSSAGIQISVSDGLASASLAPFTITVVATASGSATLTWVAPVTNNDGSVLADLAGFKLYWGPSPGAYTDSVNLSGTATLTYVVTSLTPATWYFSAKAFNSENVESSFSNEASKVVP